MIVSALKGAFQIRRAGVDVNSGSTPKKSLEETVATLLEGLREDGNKVHDREKALTRSMQELAKGKDRGTPAMMALVKTKAQEVLHLRQLGDATGKTHNEVAKIGEELKSGQLEKRDATNALKLAENKTRDARNKVARALKLLDGGRPGDLLKKEPSSLSNRLVVRKRSGFSRQPSQQQEQEGEQETPAEGDEIVVADDDISALLSELDLGIDFADLLAAEEEGAAAAGVPTPPHEAVPSLDL